MHITPKILSEESLKNLVEEQKSLNKRIVLCHGHFNVIHPGHLRFLEFAKSQGDCLVVAVQGDNFLEDKVKDVFFDENERAIGIASLEKVDAAFIYNDITLPGVIEIVKPYIYVKGMEFSEKPELIRDETDIVEKYGGKMVFGSGRIDYSTAKYLEHDVPDINEKNMELLKRAVDKQGVDFGNLKGYIGRFKDLNVLVLGDSIVDQYIACEALGMSAEAPVLNLLEVSHKQFAGGAAVVARHVRSLGARCSFISLVGEDEPGQFVAQELQKDGIRAELAVDKDRQTVFKMRYMVGQQKLLRVSRLQDHHIDTKTENLILDYIENRASSLDGVIVSDFSYGLVTPGLVRGIVKLAKSYDIKLFGDSQCSSQFGDVGKFIGFDLVTPTEKEARMSLSDTYNGLEKIGRSLLEKTKVKNLVITLAERGFVSFRNECPDDASLAVTQHFPALSVNPVDVMGAGDSLLTGLSLSLCAGANLMEASVIGAVIASIAVNKMGNIPVKYGELATLLEGLGNETGEAGEAGEAGLCLKD